MPYFLMLTKLTSEGRKTITNNPRRIQEVNKEVEAMGAKILAQYALLGPYDFMNLLEAPSNEAVARVSSALGSRGTLEPLTMTAIEMNEFLRELETAKIIKD
ncbi:MAG TPA: GYD domain-containing protein [Dehalococcoidia bacterium]|nr:GYD domain-containing protein [Dehalococcoidia bacterium]